MSDVVISVKIPQAEKDLVDGIVIAFNDFKAKKGAAIIADEMSAVIKIAGELAELTSELKERNSFIALEYLANQLLSIGV